eukprot:9297650-Pyramimonas_sp.AAC.1
MHPGPPKRRALLLRARERKAAWELLGGMLGPLQEAAAVSGQNAGTGGGLQRLAHTPRLPWKLTTLRLIT